MILWGVFKYKGEYHLALCDKISDGAYLALLKKEPDFEFTSVIEGENVLGVSEHKHKVQKDCMEFLI